MLIIFCLQSSHFSVPGSSQEVCHIVLSDTTTGGRQSPKFSNPTYRVESLKSKHTLKFCQNPLSQRIYKMQQTSELTNYERLLLYSLFPCWKNTDSGAALTVHEGVWFFVIHFPLLTLHHTPDAERSQGEIVSEHQLLTSEVLHTHPSLQPPCVVWTQVFQPWCRTTLCITVG